MEMHITSLAEEILVGYTEFHKEKSVPILTSQVNMTFCIVFLHENVPGGLIQASNWLTSLIDVITICNSSCRKVIFSQVCVCQEFCPQGDGEHLLDRHSLGRPPPNPLQ